MFRCNFMDLGNCNISCTLCGQPNTGTPQLGRLVTHSNNMACAAHVNCVLERLANSNDPLCPTCKFPVNPPKALTVEEHSFEQLNVDPLKEDPELDALIAQHREAEAFFESTSGDAELAACLQEQFNEEPVPVVQPRNPCLRRLTMTQAVWLAVAVVVAARLALRF